MFLLGQTADSIRASSSTISSTASENILALGKINQRLGSTKEIGCMERSMASVLILTLKAYQERESGQMVNSKAG